MSTNKYNELINRGVEEIIGEKELLKMLASGKKLRIKHGIDPTSTDIHLGYAVIYQKLKEFQELGHKIIFLIGDFTGRFGDPTDKLKTRKMRSAEEVKKTASKYLEQVGKILDLKKTEVRYNSEWYDKMTLEDFLHIKSNFSHAQLIERDMFQERIKKGLEINAREIDYPILQAYDSVILKDDITVCGSDQKFNELQGRVLQKEFNQKPQVVMTMPLLIGLDGKNKMSQSLGNYISIDEAPISQFGKIMSIPDELIGHYFELAARTTGKELAKIKKDLKDPKKRRDLKANLACDIVALYHGAEESSLAEEEFNRVFRDKKYPINIPEVKIKNPTCEDLPQMLVDAKLVSSKSEARRLIEQNAVKIDKAIIDDFKAKICFHDGMILQVGKLKFVKIRI